MGPESNTTCIPIRRERHTERRGPHENPDRQEEENGHVMTGRDGNDALQVKEHQGFPVMPETRRGAQNTLFLRASRKNQLCQHLDFHF